MSTSVFDRRCFTRTRSQVRVLQRPPPNHCYCSDLRDSRDFRSDREKNPDGREKRPRVCVWADREAVAFVDVEPAVRSTEFADVRYSANFANRPGANAWAGVTANDAATEERLQPRPGDNLQQWAADGTVVVETK